jgi:hypothetical protein
VLPDGRATLLMGDKLAGKTTTMLYFLQEKANAFLANDKVFVRSSPEPVARALPTAAGIRWETVAMFPELQRLVAAGSLFHVDNLDPPVVEGRMVGRRAEWNRLCVPVDILARVFAVHTVREAPVGAIAFIRYDPHADGPCITHVSTTEAMASLEAQRLDGNLKWREEWLRDGPLADRPRGHGLMATADRVRALVATTSSQRMDALVENLSAAVSP